jgi:hypothetical protein
LHLWAKVELNNKDLLQILLEDSHMQRCVTVEMKSLRTSKWFIDGYLHFDQGGGCVKKEVCTFLRYIRIWTYATRLQEENYSVKAKTGRKINEKVTARYSTQRIFIKKTTKGVLPKVDIEFGERKILTKGNTSKQRNLWGFKRNYERKWVLGCWFGVLDLGVEIRVYKCVHLFIILLITYLAFTQTYRILTFSMPFLCALSKRYPRCFITTSG